MHIKQITNQADLDTALMKIDALFEAEEGSDEYDQFLVLSELVLSYCQSVMPIEFPDPVEALRCHMHWRDRSERELAVLLGSSALAKDILNRKKLLTLPVIRSLCKEWKIPAESLIQEYALEKKLIASNVINLNKALDMCS